MTTAPRSVVIVDDDEIQALLLSDFLIGNGYSVQVAATGQGGLQTIRELMPDLVILDLVLPDISGSDVCSRLRSDKSTQAIPIILCSATKISPEDKVKGFRSGADDYLARPFELAELLARMEAVLRRVVVQPKPEMLAGIQELIAKKSEPAVVAKPRGEPATPQPAPLASRPAAVTPASSAVSPTRPPSFLLKKIWELLNHPARAIRTMEEKEEFVIAVAMVAGAPVLGSFAKLFQRGASFDGWIGGFALGLVVHLALWFAVAFILQMGLPFLGVHVSMKRALAMTGIAWLPRFLHAGLSVSYAALASVALAGQPAAFSAYGLFDAWGAWLVVLGMWTVAPLARPRWNSVVLIVGVTCFITGALCRF